MSNFFKVATGVDTLPLLAATHVKPFLWDQDTLRTSYEGSAHSESSDIILRMCSPEDPFDSLQNGPTQAWEELPQARPIIFDLMRRLESTQLGRVVITRLEPGKRIHAHQDRGRSAFFYRRFQVALQSQPGCLFCIEDETQTFKTGDVWMINNHLTHSVVNNSTKDRVVMIVDMRCGE